jgi:hypothetical protein
VEGWGFVAFVEVSIGVLMGTSDLFLLVGGGLLLFGRAHVPKADIDSFFGRGNGSKDPALVGVFRGMGAVGALAVVGV